MNLSYLLPLTSYVLFCISNTMFASREDMKGVIPLALVLGLLGGAIYMAGFRVGITGTLEQTIQGVLQAIANSLGVVVGINVFLYSLTTLCMQLFWRKKTGLL